MMVTSLILHAKFELIPRSSLHPVGMTTKLIHLVLREHPLVITLEIFTRFAPK